MVGNQQARLQLQPVCADFTKKSNTHRKGYVCICSHPLTWGQLVATVSSLYTLYASQDARDSACT